MNVTLVPATEAHVLLVAPRMRLADREEVKASGGFDAETALRESLRLSEFARTAFFDSEAACMFGVAALAGIAIPWLLTTDTVDRYPLTFWKASKIVVHELRAAYPNLTQYVDGRHAGALSWAKRLGFTVSEPEPFGKAGLPFNPIRISEGG